MSYLDKELPKIHKQLQEEHRALLLASSLLKTRVSRLQTDLKKYKRLLKEKENGE